MALPYEGNHPSQIENTSKISVGLARDGHMYAGVVYNPYLDEVFAAQRGKDACGNADQKRHDRRRDHQIKRGTERLKKDFLHRKTGGVASAHVKTERIEEIDPKLFPQRLI